MKKATRKPDPIERAKDLHHIRVDDGKHIAGINAARDEACKMIDRRTTERDQALARVKELEAEPGSFASWVVERHRAAKAEAHVAVLREAIKDHCFHPIRSGTRDTCMYCEVLATEDQAAEALLAERDRLRGDLVRMGAELGKETAEIEAERDRLKAKLDVATDALHDVCDYHAGERSCRFTYSEPDNGPCDCHVDQARAALAKIKELADARS